MLWPYFLNLHSGFISHNMRICLIENKAHVSYAHSSTVPKYFHTVVLLCGCEILYCCTVWSFCSGQTGTGTPGLKKSSFII